MEVDDLAFAEEADDVGDVGVVLSQAEDVVVGQPRLLLGGQVLGEVGDHIAGGLHGGGAPGVAGGELGVDPGGVVHEVGGKWSALDVADLQVPGELVDHRPNHFKVPQLI